MSCFRKTRQLIPRNIVPNWTGLTAAIDEKRPELSNRHGVGFHQDNARPLFDNTAKITAV